MYSARQYRCLSNVGPTNTPVYVGPDFDRHWLIDLLTLSVGVPGTGNFDAIVGYCHDQLNDHDIDGASRLVFCDVRIPENFGLTLPVVGGGAFQQYTIADPNGAIVQATMQRLYLAYPQAVLVSLPNIGAGVTWSLKFRYMDETADRIFCFPE